MLNSASRIKYPIAFNNNKREVELTGEAYFEVEKMKNKPFIIHIGNASVMVYGTSFNISAYDDDEVLQATLVEGNIGLSILKENKPVEYKLTPGKQAEYNKVTSHVETKEVNTDLYTAWTKDRFMFENESIEKILKRLARWYDLDVQYADERIKNQFFTGELNLKKYDNIVKILEMLAAASDIEFKIEQRKLIVEVRK
jgi:ferric-dicitrate binding protein FerR (iron transport regulator)